MSENNQTNNKPVVIAHLLRVAVFLIISILMVNRLSSLLIGSKYIRTWVGTTSENPIYTVPKDSLEVISFGTSWGLTSFSPLELYGEYGINAYNYSSEQQAPIVSYYVLNEVIKRQKNLKAVLLNTHALKFDWNYGLARKAFDRIPLSFEKVNGVKELVEMRPDDPFISYIIPLYKFHTRWKELNKYDFMKDIPNVANGNFKIMNGFLMGHDNQGISDFNGFAEDTGTDTYPINEDAKYYFTKMAELCKKHSITLILYVQPVTTDPIYHNTLQVFAESIDAPLLDFNMNSLASAADINWNTDTGGHQATGGAIKVSRYIGRYLHENYTLTDARKNSKYKYLESKYREYIADLENITLVSTTEIDKYLSLLINPRYSVFIAANDEASNGLQDNTQQLLYNLGLKCQIQGHYRQAYIAVIDGGKIITEQITEEVPEKAVLEYSGVFSTDVKYIIKSAGYVNESGCIASIIIDGKEYAINSRGLNFVVYDNQKKTVIDKITFDTFSDGLAKR